MDFTQVSVTIVALIALKAFYHFSRFVYIYLKPVAYHRFLHSPSSYALVTGATDGIGKAIATELFAKGFNIIIHCYDKEKLHRVQQELQSSGPGDVKTWLADARAQNIDFESVVAQWKDLEITLVINNVGGTPIRTVTFDKVPEIEITDNLRLNAIFPMLLTRAILPKLRKARGPTEIVYVGSNAGVFSVPALIPYAPAKAFLKQLSATVDADERFFGPSNIRTMCFIAGDVITGSHKPEPSLFAPTAEVFAKHAVARIGCGRSALYPYMPHAVQIFMASLLPSVVFDRVVHADMAKKAKQVKKE